MIDLRYVKKLIEMLDESTVDTIEISTDKGVRIRLSKTGAVRAGGVLTAAAAAPPATAVPAPGPLSATTPPSGGAAEGGTAANPATPPAASKLLELKSPMVGTFYGAPEPGAKPYVSVGDRIKKGQVLCIIEAMKIMNEIESEFDGVVREVLSDNAHPVEYGQVLFRIDPDG